MANRVIVDGKKVKLEVWKVDAYYPVACTVSVSFWATEEYDITSTPDSGRYRTRKPINDGDWGVDFTGVTVLQDAVDTLWYSWEFLLELVRSQGVNIRVKFIDRNGNTKSITGHVYIPRVQIEGIAGQAAGDTITFLGDGLLNLDSLITPNVPRVTRLEWFAAGAQVSFQDNQLIGKSIADIKHVSREGDDKYKVVAGAPTARQVQLDAVGGNLVFLLEADDGEYVYALIE